jgi:Domain of Unknown Function (DUF1206)
MQPDRPVRCEQGSVTVSAGTQAVRAAKSSPWPERLARFGLGARGVLYIVIGILAVRVAFGHTNEKANQSGALQEIASTTGGAVLIWLVAIGLLGFALWRLASAVFGPAADPSANDAKGRVKAAAEAVGYGAISALAIKIAVNGASSSGSGSGSKQAATVLSWPGGQFLVGLVGVIIVGVGLYFLYDGWKADFTKELKVGTVSPGVRKGVVLLGRIGRIARGVVFAILGILVITAAVQYDPQKANGLDGALKTLAAQPFGKWLLVLVALGLIAFGLYGIAEAKLRRVG